jgi:hypothetical protein
MLPLRADLLAGDYRSLYLGWLTWAQKVDPEKSGDILEPPVPPGLKKLTTPLKGLVDFLQIDENLIAVAARTSAASGPAGPTSEELAAWIAGQPEKRKNAWLLALAEDQTPSPRFEILRDFRAAWTAARPRSASKGEQRTLKQLFDARDNREEDRKTEEAAEKVRRRNAHLDTLVGRETALWRDIEQAVSSTKAAEYDRATQLIRDLVDLAERSGSKNDALARTEQLKARHKRKPAFLERLRKVGL